MALYKDGNPVSGLNSIPRLTLSQYESQNVKPVFWVWTDAPESYKKLSADQVSYDSNNTVKDKIDEKATCVSVVKTTDSNGLILFSDLGLPSNISMIDIMSIVVTDGQPYAWAIMNNPSYIKIVAINNASISSDTIKHVANLTVRLSITYKKI